MELLGTAVKSGEAESTVVTNGSIRFKFTMNKYTLSVKVHSNDTTLLDSNYTVILTKEGVYSLETPPDTNGQTQTLSGGLEIKSAMPGDMVTLRIDPGLGYRLNTVMKIEADSAGETFFDITSDVMTGYNPAADIYQIEFTMPKKHVKFAVDYTEIAAVPGVAYVSGDGWNKNSGEGYDASFINKYGVSKTGLATKWGTASNDLQAVINSWDGDNFKEIWVQGTVAPKTRAQSVKDGDYSISSADITLDTPDPDLAFVIPPGLKIYGGFTGKEEQGNTGSRFPGPISANAANDKRVKTETESEDWRQRSVLSGILNSLTRAHHVVIMAEIPYTDPDNNAANTILDGLTVSGGQGADNVGAITVKGQSIDKQSGAGLYLVNASPILRHLRIQENTATGRDATAGGGGIYNLATGGSGKVSSPRLSHTLIYKNTVSGAGFGGGMFNDSRQYGSVCNPQLDNVTIERNTTSGQGGGLFICITNNGTCAPYVTASKIVLNSGASGGGVSIAGGSAPFFDGVNISGNSAANSGGGVYTAIFESRPMFNNVTIAGNNTSVSGGGIFNNSGYLYMTNATISGNMADLNGGGIYNATNGGAVLTNIRIEKNKAGNGGAVYNYVNLSQNRTVMIITNGVIRENHSIVRNVVENIYDFSGRGTINANTVLHLALTNVLIAENRGGGISSQNAISGTNEGGKGISILLNSVTIAGNRVNSGSGGGLALTVPINDGTSGNKEQVVANNVIIWGNSDSNTGSVDHDNIYASSTLPYRLRLNNSLVEDQGANLGAMSQAFNPKNAAAFTGAYGPFAGGGSYAVVVNGTNAGSDAAARLINGGDNALYPDEENDFLDDGSMGGAFDGAASRKDNFINLIFQALFDDSLTGFKSIDRDAYNGLGDLAHTTTVGTAGDVNSVTVTRNTTPTSPSAGLRVKGGSIDVGAYEKE
jgi:hypothetical protein